MMRIREGSVEIGNEFRWLNPEIASPDGEKDGNETKWDESGKRFLSVLLTLINLEFPIHQGEFKIPFPSNCFKFHEFH